MIYFIQIGDDGPIKIGTTENVEHRLATLQIANPERLRLLGVMPEERETHRFFGDLHMRGEWFESGQLLLEFIKQYTKEEPELGWSDLSCAGERYKAHWKSKSQKPGIRKCTTKGGE